METTAVVAANQPVEATASRASQPLSNHPPYLSSPLKINVDRPMSVSSSLVAPLNLDSAMVTNRGETIRNNLRHINNGRQETNPTSAEAGMRTLLTAEPHQRVLSIGKIEHRANLALSNIKVAINPLSSGISSEISSAIIAASETSEVHVMRSPLNSISIKCPGRNQPMLLRLSRLILHPETLKEPKKATCPGSNSSSINPSTTSPLTIRKLLQLHPP
jgi:hypothetical protein